MDKQSGIEEIHSEQIHRWAEVGLAQIFCGIRWLLTMILFHDTIFSEITCKIINITFIFLEVLVWQFVTMVPAITLQRAFIWLLWHKGKLVVISPLPGL